jgi:MFS family permease
VLVDAVSFLGSALFLVRIRTVEEPRRAATQDSEKSGIWTELKEGLRFVLGNPNLRAQAGCTATSNFFFNVSFAIIVVFFVRELELSPGLIGLVFSISSVGSLVAAFTSRRISERFGIGPTTIGVMILQGPAILLTAFAPTSQPLPYLIAGGVIIGFAVVVYNITQVSYRQAICPAQLQGRMNSVMRFLVWGTIPLGSLIGGALGTWLGLRETIVIGAIGAGLSFLWILLSPQRHLREMPEPVDDSIAEPAPA